MSYIPLEDAKAHLKQTLDDDDADIQGKLDAAEEWAAEFLNRDLSESDVVVDPDASPLELKPSVKLAILQRLEATYYRDPNTMGPLTKDAQEMLYPFRIGLGV